MTVEAFDAEAAAWFLALIAAVDRLTALVGILLGLVLFLLATLAWTVVWRLR